MWVNLGVCEHEIAIVSGGSKQKSRDSGTSRITIEEESRERGRGGPIPTESGARSHSTYLGAIHW
jgi:hypothetical protein